MKKLQVQQDKCIGCGACVAIDPEHFDFDDGKSNVISNENLDNENVMNAIESCPTSAISLKEENNVESCPTDAIPAKEENKDCSCQNEECCENNCEECKECENSDNDEN